MNTRDRAEVKDKVHWMQVVADASDAIQGHTKLYGATDAALHAQRALLELTVEWSRRLTELRDKEEAL